MATFRVPSQIKSIQEAVRVAKSGDTIVINSGVYYGSIFITKDNLTLTTDNKTVVVLPVKGGDDAVGIQIQANGVKISGMQFRQFYTGVSVIGDFNEIVNTGVYSGKRDGFMIRGNDNLLLSSRAAQCSTVGIGFSGSRNKIIANRLEDNSRGVISYIGVSENNLIQRNILMNNKEFGIRISVPSPSRNVVERNVVENSQLGISFSYGTPFIVNNNISGCSDAAIMIETNNCFIDNNILINNRTGIQGHTSNSQINRNSVQDGRFAGISIAGNGNEFISNTVVDYDGTGMLIQGDDNKIVCNAFDGNGRDLIVSGCSNVENDRPDCCKYPR